MIIKETMQVESKLVKMRADNLVPHPLAQRSIMKSKLKKMVAKPDFGAIGVLHVVEYNAAGKGLKSWIIDGQHRWKMLMDIGRGEYLVEVKVHLDVTDDRRASDLFLKLNDRSPVTPWDKFYNELIAGLPEAVNSLAIAKRHGIIMGRTTSDGQLSCVVAVKKIYLVDAGLCLSTTFGVIKGAWGTKAAALEGKLLEGLGRVLARYKENIDLPTLVKKLAKYSGGASGLLGDAKGLTKHRKGTLVRGVADCIIDVYNSGRHVGKLDPL